MKLKLGLLRFRLGLYGSSLGLGKIAERQRPICESISEYRFCYESLVAGTAAVEGESIGGEEKGADNGATHWASKYCLDCRQEMCTKCAVLHHKMKISRNHNVVELGSRLNVEKLRHAASYCDRHEEELLKMYCFQCQRLVCLLCFAEEHSRCAWSGCKVGC